MGLRVLFSLQRPQEVDDVLLLQSSQPIETFNDFICLAAAALVISDGFHQVGRPSVMEEEDALAERPQAGPHMRPRRTTDSERVDWLKIVRKSIHRRNES